MRARSNKWVIILCDHHDQLQTTEPWLPGSQNLHIQELTDGSIVYELGPTLKMSSLLKTILELKKEMYYLCLWVKKPWFDLDLLVHCLSDLWLEWFGLVQQCLGLKPY